VHTPATKFRPEQHAAVLDDATPSSLQAWQMPLLQILVPMQGVPSGHAGSAQSAPFEQSSSPAIVQSLRCTPCQDSNIC